jgi:ribosomal protein S18 acetylase RimI-like enzyme
MTDGSPGGTAVDCARMSAATRGDARALLGEFLLGDIHYRATSGRYGDGGIEALDRALELFLSRPELGFVWLAHAQNGARREAAGACVVCFAISTARGSLVAKLDDVIIASRWQRAGIGGAMMRALAAELRALGATRIDSSCHRDNVDAWRFYERLGFRALDEERIAWLI